MTKKIQLLEPPKYLFSKVMNRIHDTQRKSAKRKLVFYIILDFLSFLSLIPAFFWIQTDTVKSGFYTFISLIISDWDTIASYWQDFSLSIVESFPFVSATVFLILLFLLLFGLKSISSNFSIIYNQQPSLKYKN